MDEVFDPYSDAELQRPAHSRATTDGTLVASEEDAALRPPVPIEAGYGGGVWTHREITEEEKSRMEPPELGDTTIRVQDLTEEERERRRSEIKSPYGPSSPTAQSAESDPLPQYVAFPDPELTPWHPRHGSNSPDLLR